MAKTSVVRGFSKTEVRGYEHAASQRAKPALIRAHYITILLHCRFVELAWEMYTPRDRPTYRAAVLIIVYQIRWIWRFIACTRQLRGIYAYNMRVYNP